MAPHDYAVTTGTRISIVDYAASKEKRAISKFKDVVLSGSYRADGRLLVTGGKRPLIQVFDMGSRNILRQMKGHDGPIQVTRFATDNTHIFSAGDDCSVRYWDVSSGECQTVLESAHSDYIRCGQASPSTPSLFVTGSYDHTVRIWDLRASAGSSGAVVGRGAGMAVDADGGDEEADEVLVSGQFGGAAGAGADDSDAESDAGEDAESDGDSRGLARAGMDADESDEDDDDEAEAGAGSGAASRTGAHAVGEASASGAARHSSAAAVPAGALRAGSGSSLPAACALSVDHGCPVTQVQLMPGGGTLLTAGGNYIRVWDLVAGGRLLHETSVHQKLITAMTLDGTATRLLTGGLDSLVKVYELATFSVTHTMRADAPILSMAVSPDNARLVLGTTDSSLTTRHRIAKVAEIVTEKKSARLLRGGTYRYFMRGQGTVAGVDDVVVAREKGDRKRKLASYDKLLRRFEYGAALDAAVLTNSAVIATSVIQELVLRDGLHRALAHRDEERLAPILSFLVKHISDPRHAPLLLDVADGESRSAGGGAGAGSAMVHQLHACSLHDPFTCVAVNAPLFVAPPAPSPAVVVSMYATTIGSSSSLDSLFMRLRESLTREVLLGKELLALQGSLDLLMAAATTGSGETMTAAESGFDDDY